VMYFKGSGITQDSLQAVELFRKACDQGEATGCNNFGVMHEQGAGVRQSNSDALSFYGKACDMKDEKGCKNYARVKSQK